MKKKFKIPVTWEMFGTVTVEANSLEEAIEFFDNFEKEEGFTLPSNESYVDGSFQREDEENCQLMNQQ